MPNTYDPLKQYLTSNGQAFSAANLKDLAASKGMTNYSMSDADNTKLASLLQSPSAGVSSDTPTKTVTAPAVYSGQQAADHMTNKVIPTVQQEQARLDEFNKSKMTASDKGGIETPATPAPTTPTTPTTPAPVGTKTAYNPADGTSLYVPISAKPEDHGLSSTKPTTPTAVDTVDLASGDQIRKYADGTYDMYNGDGVRIKGVNAANFENAKRLKEATDNIYSAMNGSYPLKPEQQAALDRVKREAEDLMVKQQQANDNYTGGTTVAMNLYGIGNTVFGQNQIADTVTQGAKKIQAIQDNLTSTLAQMTSAYKNDNLKALSDAYNTFQKKQDELQKTIDTLHTDTINAAKAEQTQKAADQKAIDDDIRTMISSVSKNGGAYDTETISKMSQALANHDYAAAAAAGAKYITDLNTFAGRLAKYRKDSADAGIPLSAQLTDQQYYEQEKFKQTAADKKAASLADVNNAPFAATILRAAAKASGMGKTDDAKIELANLANQGDYKSLLGRMKDLAKEGMQAADKSEITKAETKVLALDRMSKALKAYQEANGSMNILKGTEDDIGRALGKLATDGTYGVIGTELDSAFQQYRQDMTGAAFGDQESREYAKVMPSKKNSFELNNVIMQGLKNYLSGKVQDAYSNALGEGYQNIKDRADAQKDFGQQHIETQVQKADTIKQYMTDDTYGPQIKAFWEKHPDLSAQDIYDGMQQLNLLPPSGPTSFNNVGGATNTASAPTDLSKKIVGGIDLNGYAVDPNQPKAIATTYNNLSGVSDFTDYIKSKFPKSPITNAAIQTVANTFGIVPSILVALIQHESRMGTTPVALKNNNYGGITWTPTYAAANPGVMKGSERPKSEWNADGSPTYYVKFATPEDGLMAQAKLLSNRKVV